MANEKFLETQKGKVIVGVSIFAAVIVVYIAFAAWLKFWPFSAKLTKDSYNTIRTSFKVETDDTKINVDTNDKAKTLVQPLRDQFEKINKIKKQLQETTQTKLTTVENEISQAEAKAKTNPFATVDFRNAYKKISQDDINSLLDLVKQDLNL
ncbi:hypothetical protein [Candidatus Phytoplasma pini]|uniref:Immunodominant membrane protein n=1 Tax=Candidatus Phytoplasma pini TaxID=267362 RepID=A0A559KJR0_9MOLU|nr:hypothetical protein [Candidatus Phytoplasma pini]TVY12375.1 hypothetical protein MDPP_00149 [Candidatus Phytoplasma pini]